MLAKEAGLLYAAVAVATDYDCWRDCGNKVNVADVLEMFKKNVEKVKLIFVEAVSTIAAEKWDDTIKEAQVYFHIFYIQFIIHIQSQSKSSRIETNI